MASQHDLFQYLKQRHHWDHATLMTIDWKIFRKAATSHPATNSQLMKLVHDKLPTNHYKSKRDATVSSKCHYCSEQETFQHLCTSSCNETSIKFREKVRQQVTQYLQKICAPAPFLQTYVKSLEHSLQCQRSEINSNCCPTQLQTSQDSIGWPLFLRGFLAQEWRKHMLSLVHGARLEQWLCGQDQTEVERLGHNRHYDGISTSQHKGLNPQIHVETVMVKLIHILWDNMLHLWQEHLQLIHTTTSLGRQEKLISLRQEVRTLHQLQQQVLSHHRSQYFHEDLDTYLDQANVHMLQRYLDRYKPVIYHSIHQATQRSRHSHLITKFFDPVINTRDQQDINQQAREVRHRKHTRIRNWGTAKITSYFFPLLTQTFPT
jgi:hypothetical protein